MDTVAAFETETVPAEVGRLWALEDLPPFPPIATQIMRLVARETVRLDEIGRLISADPVFAADVLRVANSALFGLRFEVTTIAHAIVVLGLQRVKGISLTRALDSYLAPALDNAALERCWQHSLAGAVLCEKLARTCGIDRDLAYTAGLLRDIGRLALLVKYPDAYTNLLAVTQENGLDLLFTERELFDVDHCEAGVWLTHKMQIPPELRQVVARHHQCWDRYSFGLVQLTAVADRLSEVLGFGPFPATESLTYDSVLDNLPDPLRRAFHHAADGLRAELAEKIRLFS